MLREILTIIHCTEGQIERKKQELALARISVARLSFELEYLEGKLERLNEAAKDKS